MPTLDPRYRYPAGWWAGNTALGLADLLGQGFDRLHQQNQDELGQQNKDQAFKLQLQQFLSGEQDRSSDRALRQQTADLQGKQIEDLMAQRKAKADEAVAQRSALAKFFGGLGQDVPTQEPAPQPPPQALAVSPQAEDRTLGQFIYGTRKATPQDAIEGMGAEAGNLPTNFTDALLKFYQEKAPKPPKFGFGAGLGTYDESTGKVATPVPDKPEKPAPNPTETTVLLDAARDRLEKQGVTDPTPGQLGTMAETIKQERAKAGAPNTTVNLSPGERDTAAKTENVSNIGKDIQDIVAKTKGLVGGPMGMTGRANSMRLLFNIAPDGYATLNAKLGQLRAQLINELAGAAIGPDEAKLYLRSMPDTDQSDQVFHANLDETIKNIDRLRGIRTRIQTTPKGQPISAPTTETPSGAAQYRWNPTTRQLEPIQ